MYSHSLARCSLRALERTAVLPTAADLALAMPSTAGAAPTYTTLKGEGWCVTSDNKVPPYRGKSRFGAKYICEVCAPSLLLYA